LKSRLPVVDRTASNPRNALGDSLAVRASSLDGTDEGLAAPGYVARARGMRNARWRAVYD